MTSTNKFGPTPLFFKCATSWHLYKTVETKMKMSVYELLLATYINISDGHSSHCFF